MTRQTECKDYSGGIFPSLAVIQAERRYQIVQVAQRGSSSQIVFARFLEIAPRTQLREALGDLQAHVAHLRSEDRLRVLGEVRAIAQGGQYIALDTETTGLKNTDQIVSWAIVGPDGKVLGQGLVKATVPISESARQTHRIREEHLADAPAFGVAWAAIGISTTTPKRNELTIGKTSVPNSEKFQHNSEKSTMFHRKCEKRPYAHAWPEKAAHPAFRPYFFRSYAGKVFISPLRWKSQRWSRCSRGKRV